jgi:multisubunit Na+/H+ antiporter MnhB subunit
MTQSPRRRRRERQLEWRAEMTVIVRTLIRSLLPIVLVFGAYIISFGHLTPGGGFQGGMILVGAVMSIYLAYGYDAIRRIDDEDLDLLEHLGALLYAAVGLVGLIVGGAFLANVLPAGQVGSLLSGGIVFVLNLAVGFKVAAGTLIVLLILLEALRKGA